MSTQKFIICAVLTVVLLFLLRGIPWLEELVGGRNLWTSSLNLIVVFSMFLLLTRLIFCIWLTIGYLLLKPALHFYADRSFIDRGNLFVFRYFIWDRVYDYKPRKETPDKRRNQKG